MKHGGSKIRSLKEIYALAVCFIAAIGLTISTSMILYSAIQVVAPEFSMHTYLYERYQSNQSYVLYLSDRGSQIPDDESEVTRLREKAYVSALHNERRGGFQSIVRNAIAVVVLLVVFLLHWKLGRGIAKKEKAGSKEG